MSLLGDPSGVLHTYNQNPNSPLWSAEHFCCPITIQNDISSMHLAALNLLHWNISSIKQSLCLSYSPFHLQYSKHDRCSIRCHVALENMGSICLLVFCEVLCPPAVVLCHLRPRNISPLTGGPERNLFCAAFWCLPAKTPMHVTDLGRTQRHSLGE